MPGVGHFVGTGAQVPPCPRSLAGRRAGITRGWGVQRTLQRAVGAVTRRAGFGGTSEAWGGVGKRVRISGGERMCKGSGGSWIICPLGLSGCPLRRSWVCAGFIGRHLIYKAGLRGAKNTVSLLPTGGALVLHSFFWP